MSRKEPTKLDGSESLDSKTKKRLPNKDQIQDSVMVSKWSRGYEHKNLLLRILSLGNSNFLSKAISKSVTYLKGRHYLYFPRLFTT